MKKLLFFVVAVSFLAVSCKNKNAGKMLEGTWNEVKINGANNPEGNQDQIIFGKCNGGKKADCDLTITDCCGGGTYNYKYTVREKGTQLTIKDCVGILCAEVNHTIVSLTDNSMTIDWGWGNGSYTGEYTKQ